ncbi:MAG: hypothetical protein V4572_04005 [Bacteroidota bacterium]
MRHNKRKKYFVLLYCFFLMSCSDNSKKLNFLICNDSIKYWDYNMIRGEQNVWFTFSFDKNENVIKYSFNKKNNKRWLFTDYGMYTERYKWNVTKDSILEFMGNTEKIIKISRDTLFTYNLKDREMKKYICVKGDLNIQD